MIKLLLNVVYKYWLTFGAIPEVIPYIPQLLTLSNTK